MADDQVLVRTRVVAAAIVPFLVVAFAVLYPWPTDTGRLFAWPIRPTFTAMVLGAVYLGGAYFFVRVLFARRWHTVAGGFVPVGTFATLLGITTVVHWDRFERGHVAFWLWAGLYFTTPFLVFWVWWVNRRRAVPASDQDLLIPQGTARLIAVCGGLAGLTAGFLLLFPGTAAASWPWPLTPLTARVLGAVFCLGIAGLGAPYDRRWSSVRIPLQVAALMLTLILVAALRAHREFAGSRPLAWPFAVGFAGLLATIGLMYVTQALRERQ